MSDAVTRLKSLKVADVMSRHVVQINEHRTMAEAAGQFLEHGISGAPVVNDQEECVGILSAMDFVQREVIETKDDGVSPGESEHRLNSQPPDVPFRIVSMPDDPVRSHMSTTIYSVPPEMSLLEAAQLMSLRHLHRLPVLNLQRQPVGLITSMDVVAALLTAMEEMEQ